MRLRKMVNDFGMIIPGRDYTLSFSDVSRCKTWACSRLRVVDEQILYCDAEG